MCVFFTKLFIPPPPLCFKSVYLPTATPHLPTPHCTRLSKALGAAAQHLMQWTRPPDADTKGLYLAVHADTDQEWSDHTLRSDIDNIDDASTLVFGELEDIDGEPRVPLRNPLHSISALSEVNLINTFNPKLILMKALTEPRGTPSGVLSVR